MEQKKILWLDDQYEDYIAYQSAIFRTGYLVDFLKSVSETERRLREEGKNYTAVIFDLKVLPGNDEKWKEFDEKKRQVDPYFDSYLGLELLRSIFNPDEAEVKLEPPITIDPKKIIIFSVLSDEKILTELQSLGIPENQIVNKSADDLKTLPELIKRMRKPNGDTKKMSIKKILWLEDQYEDLIAYQSSLARMNYLVDVARSVSEAEKKLREEIYFAVIFDFKVLPGENEKWIEVDEKIRRENPKYDTYLGLELLRALFKPDKAKVKLVPPIKIDPKKVIIFSVVSDKVAEISSFGIPKEQIIYKSTSDLSTLSVLIEKMQNEE